jgi:flagellar basal body-associated protein FliL
MEPLIVVVFLIGGATIVAYTYFSSKHKERMSMIEKGLKPADYKGLVFSLGTSADPLSSLRWGLLAVFIGFGFFAGLAMNEFAHFQKSFSIALMLIFGGLGLIVFYFIASKKMKEQGQEQEQQQSQS